MHFMFSFTFSSCLFLKICHNEEPWKQHHDNKGWSTVDNTNAREVIEHAQFKLFRVLGHEQAHCSFSR